DIRQGLIWVTEASREQWVPQHIDWHHQGGISFRKGCYTGQEIVARLQYLGKSNKQVIQLHSAEPLSLAVLTPLQDEQGKAIGEVARWAGQQGLAVINAGAPPAAPLARGRSRTGAGLFYTDGINAGTDTEPAQ